MILRRCLPAAALCAVATLLPALPAAAQPLDARPASQAVSVRARLVEWAIRRAPAVVPSGRVRFVARNAGVSRHELVVIKTRRRANALGRGLTVPERGARGEIEEFGPGRTRSMTLRLAPGHYALICNLPGHYRAGMRADLWVDTPRG
ncbi:MAG: plastocyanin/azurin family copper-binding protein [Solirubrobacteraceae bacterium]